MLGWVGWVGGCMGEGSEQHIDWRTFPEPSSFPLKLYLHWPLTVGDISVFKGMQINELNLQWCDKLTGAWVRVGGSWMGEVGLDQ